MDFPLSITVLIMGGAAMIAGSIAFWSLKLGITPTPSGFRVRRALKTLLPTDLKNDIVDLGCGWGSLLPMLQKQYPNSQILGCERSSIPWLFSYCRFYGERDIKVVQADLFEMDLSKASLVVCYLQKDIMKALSVHCRSHLPSGCYILSHTFHLPDWEPLKTVTAPDLYRTPVYLYQQD